MWMQDAAEFAAPFLQTGTLRPDGKGVNTPVFAYGVRTNKDILSAIPQFSHEQGLTPRVVGLEEIFAPQTMDL
jgi:hypothetical protein